MPELSVVVPATDAPPTLERCLCAIRAADADVEVIVVDAPTTASASRARNLGVERARGDIVVFVDADVEIHPDALDRIRASFRRRPEVSAVFGSYDDTPFDRGAVSAFRNLLHHHVHRSSGGVAETFWTGLGAVRRDRFVAIGGFDESRYPHPSIEDIDLGSRLHLAGDTILLDPDIQGTHLKVWTLRSVIETDFARRGVPWVALQLRQRRVSGALNLGWQHRLSAAACVVGLVATLARRPRAVIAAVALVAFLNQRFYRLLHRRLGPGRALAGIALHWLHHLVAVAAVPSGAAVALAEQRGRPVGTVRSSAPSIDRVLSDVA